MSRHRPLRLALRAPAVGLLGLATISAPAQDTGAGAAGTRALAIVPTLSLLETYTDNRLLTLTDRQASLISQVVPGLRITSTTGRVQGDLVYTLNANAYTPGAAQNNFQNTLNGAVHADVVDKQVFVDAAATIGQQSISAFGTQTPDPSLQTANQSEVGTYSVSPTLRGSFAGLANYDVQGSYQVVHSDGYEASNSRTNAASFKLQSERSAGGHFGWGATLSHQGIAYAQTRSTVTDRASVNLDYAATPELVFTASAGREASNLTTIDKESVTIRGGGVDWRPSDRTHLSFSHDKRAYGDAHSALIEFRTPRTVWRYADTQDVSTSATTAVGSTQTVYDLLFTQYASLYPDPTLRAQMVNAALSSSGLSAGTLVSGGFLSAAPSLQRRQELSLALNGQRTTTFLTAFQTRTSLLSTSSGAQDDLSTQGTVRQRGLGATVSHRLTPESSLNASVSVLKSSASSSALATDLRTLTLAWTTHLGPHAIVSLSARRTAFTSSTQPYRESALVAGLGFQF